ncbi:MAG: hypothetical protein WA418_39475 [Bradyrhizobium sp.]
MIAVRLAEVPLDRRASAKMMAGNNITAIVDGPIVESDPDRQRDRRDASATMAVVGGEIGRID